MNAYSILEYEFNPRVAVGDVEPYLVRATEASVAARAQFSAELDILYGDSRLMTCDIFSAAQKDAPVHVFVHGGYWRGRDKSDYSFIAAALVPKGITTIVINYDLCPAVSVEKIVSEIDLFFDWLTSRVANGKQRVVASGHSAGAHLIVMADVLSQKIKTDGLGIDHAVLISGLYDLRPVLEVSVNEIIGLTYDSAIGLSPSLSAVSLSMPVDVVVGGAESRSWISQSVNYASQVNALEGCWVLDGHNHYSIMEELMAPQSDLAQLLVRRSHGNI